MRKASYVCTTCGTTMSCKPRFGSRQFESSSYAVQIMQGQMLGRIVDDPGRPAATPDNIIARKTEDGAKDHNLTLLFGAFDRPDQITFPVPEEKRRPVYARLEPCQDLEIRVSIYEGPHEGTVKQEAFKQLDMLLKSLTPPNGTMLRDPKNPDSEQINEMGLTATDVTALKCYLVGGHDWECVDPGEM